VLEVKGLLPAYCCTTAERKDISVQSLKCRRREVVYFRATFGVISAVTAARQCPRVAQLVLPSEDL
jgi:hypothetical protein